MREKDRERLRTEQRMREKDRERLRVLRVCVCCVRCVCVCCVRCVHVCVCVTVLVMVEWFLSVCVCEKNIDKTKKH